MRLSDSPGDACATGATSDVDGPAVGLASPANGSSSTDTTPLYSGGAGDAAGDSGTVTVEVFGGNGTSGSPLQTLPVARSGASWSTEGPALVARHLHGSRAAGRRGRQRRLQQPQHVHDRGSGHRRPAPRKLPPPVTGKAVNVVPVKGVVTVRRPGGRTVRLREGAQIPTGSVVDTRRGTVRLFSTGAGGKIQSALFFDGLFRVTQTKGAKPLTDLKLVEKLARCPQARQEGAQLRQAQEAAAVGRRPRLLPHVRPPQRRDRLRHQVARPGRLQGHAHPGGPRQGPRARLQAQEDRHRQGRAQLPRPLTRTQATRACRPSSPCADLGSDVRRSTRPGTRTPPGSRSSSRPGRRSSSASR